MFIAIAIHVLIYACINAAVCSHVQKQSATRMLLQCLAVMSLTESLLLLLQGALSCTLVISVSSYVHIGYNP